MRLHSVRLSFKLSRSAFWFESMDPFWFWLSACTFYLKYSRLVWLWLSSMAAPILRLWVKEDLVILRQALRPDLLLPLQERLLLCTLNSLPPSPGNSSNDLEARVPYIKDTSQWGIFELKSAALSCGRIRLPCYYQLHFHFLVCLPAKHYVFLAPCLSTATVLYS